MIKNYYLNTMKTTQKITFTTLAFAILLIFAQCGNKEVANTVSESACTAACPTPAVKIVYVDLDSLMNNYNLAKDINKAMMRKEEDFKMKLTEKYKALQADQADFERKYKNNVYATPERAQEEYNRIVKKEQEIIQLEQQLTAEFEKEGLQKNQMLRDSISNFIKEYNKEKGYALILTTSAASNTVIVGNPALDITQDVLTGLNDEYIKSKKQ